MVYVLKNVPIYSRDKIVIKKLSCMQEKNIEYCKNLIHDRNAIQQRLDKAQKAKQVLENENAKKYDIIKESEAAKAYFGLK